MSGYGVLFGTAAEHAVSKGGAICSQADCVRTRFRQPHVVINRIKERLPGCRAPLLRMYAILAAFPCCDYIQNHLKNDALIPKLQDMQSGTLTITPN